MVPDETVAVRAFDPTGTSGTIDRGCQDRGVGDEGRTMRERMLAGESFRFDESFADDVRRCRDLLRRVNDARPDQDAERDACLRELLGSFGERSNIRPPFRCELGFQTFLGDRVFANFGLVCLDTAPVTIGDDTLLGPRVQLLAATHPLEPGPRRDGWESGEPITIGRNVWLGGAVVVCPGVTIGDDTVVGAGSVVTRDLPTGVLAVGNPARVVRRVGT
jgi:maltose O-acetyltransferase